MSVAASGAVVNGPLKYTGHDGSESRTLLTTLWPSIIAALCARFPAQLGVDRHLARIFSHFRLETRYRARLSRIRATLSTGLAPTTLTVAFAREVPHELT